MSIKKLISTLFSGGMGGVIGYVFGKTLHDAIVYHPIYKFKDVTWFNATQYLKLYYQYSCGLDNLFGLVFGIIGLGIGGLIGYEIGKIYEKINKYGLY